MKRVVLLLIVLILSAGSLQLYADGIAIGPGYGRSPWRLIDEDRQVAFISYVNGQERMLVRFFTKKAEKDVCWLLPIPSTPESLDFDIVRFAISVGGADLYDRFNHRWKIMKNIAVGSQLYTIPFLFAATAIW
ncbi:hypothetical protein H5T87_08960 [bacterium]|nr:hypothetical protein [bacterium]